MKNLFFPIAVILLLTSISQAQTVNISTFIPTPKSDTTAFVGGNAGSDGGSAITARGVCWSTKTNPTVTLTTKTNNGKALGCVGANISGLTKGTTYFARAYVTNATGTTYGPQRSFVAGALPDSGIAKKITTFELYNITDSTATCGGSIGFDGGYSITARGVCWSSEPNPSILLPTKTNNGTAGNCFTSNIKGLKSGTKYYVRAYATNAKGTSYGQEISFVTPDLVTIGNQVWMGKNLDVANYRNGDPIPNVTDPTTWAALTTGAWCWYNNDSATYASTYGKLYNWYAVNDPRSLAPAGWHIPSDAEWTELSTKLGGDAVAGSQMKETGTTHWIINNSATNSSGFAALPGGYRNYNEPFSQIGKSGAWWSSTVSGPYTAWCRYLDYSIGSFGRSFSFDRTGYSVRCIKD